MAFIILFFFFWKSLKKFKKTELFPRNFRYDVLHLLYSGPSSFFIETKSYQNHEFFQYLSNLAEFNNLNKNFSKKILPNNPPKESSQKISTQFLKKILKFWKYPIPYITLRGRKPFWACLQQELWCPHVATNRWRQISMLILPSPTVQYCTFPKCL